MGTTKQCKRGLVRQDRLTKWGIRDYHKNMSPLDAKYLRNYNGFISMEKHLWINKESRIRINTGEQWAIQKRERILKEV